MEQASCLRNHSSGSRMIAEASLPRSLPHLLHHDNMTERKPGAVVQDPARQVGMHALGLFHVLENPCQAERDPTGQLKKATKYGEKRKQKGEGGMEKRQTVLLGFG